MEEKAKVQTKKKGPKMVVLIIVGIILIMLLGMQVFASVNGYGNIFFMIKNLVTTGTVTGEEEIFLDKEITLSYQSIDIADGVKVQINKLEIKENESTLCLTVKADEKNKVLPLQYSIKSEGLSETDVKGEYIPDTYGEFEERLTVNYKFSDDELMILYIKDKDGNLLREIEINLNSHEIFVKGENDTEKISQIELKKYLNVFSELNNGSSEIDQLIKMAYKIIFMNNPDRLDVPGIEDINQVVKEVYGDEVAFEKVKNEEGNEVEILKKDSHSEFSYSLKSNVYSIELDSIEGICLKINNISYEDGIYTVKYIYTIASQTDIDDEKVEELPQYEATIKLRRNEDAEYSKYQIVELSKGKEVKEKVEVKIDKNVDNDDMKITKEVVSGNYVYYEAKDENGKDVGYREIFGSSYSMNHGKLTLNDDGTFEGYLPGVSDKAYATEGTFEIDGNNIILKYSDSRKETLEFVNAQDYQYIRIKQKYADYTLILKLNNDENKSETSNNTDQANTNISKTFSNDEIKNAIQNYLDLNGALEGSPEGLLVKLGLTSFGANTEKSDNNYIKTNIKYSEYKAKMLNYMTEQWFENNFTKWFKNVNGYLYYSDVGATGRTFEVESVALKGDYSSLSYIANVYNIHIDDSKEQENIEFHIENYNGKCVISYCD